MRISHSLRSYHNMSPPDLWKWKWSNGVGKSEMSIIWCISITNNMKSNKKFNETAQTANFTDFRLSYRSLVLLRGQICNSINQLDVSLFGETDKSGNLTRLAFFTVLLYKHLIQHNNLLQNPFQHPWNRYVTWHNIAFFCAFHIAMRTHFSNRINLKLKIPLIEPSFSLGTLPFMRFLYSVLCSFLFSASTFRQR